MRGRVSIFLLTALVAGGLFGLVSPGTATGDTTPAPQVTSQAPAPEASGAASTTNDTTTEQTMKKAMFGAGCFWGIEANFRRIPGVIDAPVGYSGGTVENPTYRMVCTGTTGHAEVVEVTYDPTQVTYEQLLDAFWKMHDPTQLNRQGPDVGSQYRSVIFTYDDEQAQIARASKAALMASSPVFQSRPIVTEITPVSTFWRAEEYHQRYLEKRGLAQCH